MIRLPRTAAALATAALASTLSLTSPGTAHATSPARHTATTTTTVAAPSKVTIGLADAPIPASCEHAATHLDGTKRNWGTDGFAELVTKQARQGHLKGLAAPVVEVPLVCSAGGVTWPEYLLTYKAGPTLIRTVPLGSKSVPQEHEDVTGLAFTHTGTVAVSWQGYDGAGFHFSHYKGTLAWDTKAKHATWTHTGPLTIDYNSGQSPDFVIDAPNQAQYATPAPAALESFLQHEWSKLAARDTCGQTAEVTLSRYSHKGFAVGSEGDCGGAVYLWGQVKGTWKTLILWQDYPGCGTLTKLERAGYVATGQECWDTKKNKAITLGNWPHSGM